MRISRADESRLTAWWFTVDHILLAAILILVCVGSVLSLAASPQVALKKGLDTFYFFERHLVFCFAGVLVMTCLSFFDPRQARRFSLVLFLLGLAALIWVGVAGIENNGARRWLGIAGFTVQPSEFLKPAFVVVSAWLIAQSRERTDMPALSLAVLLLLGIVVMLVRQPDIGQALLLVTTWGALYVLSGLALVGFFMLAFCACAGLVGAYFFLPHVAARVDIFLGGKGRGAEQVGRAAQSFVEGGFLGRGPGEGTIKTVLPDAHTDFIFAVVAEEYGVLACLVLLALFAFITLRAMRHAGRQRNLDRRLAIQGLALLFGLQAFINMSVNVGLLPAKGMTLPLISAGGSSMLAISITLGLLLAFARRRPDDLRPAEILRAGAGYDDDGVQHVGSSGGSRGAPLR